MLCTIPCLTKLLLCPGLSGRVLGLARLGVPIVSVISKLTGKTPLYTSFSLQALKSNRHMSHEKASRELGYQPRPFRESLADTLQWFKDRGQLSCPIIRENRETV